MRRLLFRALHRLAARHPILTVLVSVAAAGILGGYGAAEMQLITDQDKLISEDLDYHKRYMEFLDRFGDLEFLYVLIEGPDRDSMARFADTLAERLRQSEDIETVVYSFPTAWMRDYALHYAPLEDVERLASELADNRDGIDQLYSTGTLDDVLMEIADGVGGASPSSALDAGPDELDPLIAALDGVYQGPFAEFADFEEELERAMPDGPEYLWSDKGNALLLLVMPAKDFSTLSVIERPLQRIRADIQLTELDFDGRVTAGLTGRPALQADEMATTNDDMLQASISALIGVAILFSLFFREICRPALAMLALLMAMGWTYGAVALTLGHLNLLSTVFALVLIGLGVDFGIHYLHRYQEELGKSGDSGQAALDSLHRAGSGIITGALTSSVAFLLALFTDFLGLAELGYVAGIGILFCLVAMLLTLPALLVLFDGRLRNPHIPTPVHLLGLRHGARHPLILVLVLTAASVYFGPKAFDVTFNDNLLELQAEGLESVEYEHKLMEESEYSTWYCAFQEPDMESVRETVRQLDQNPLVAGHESLIDVLPKNLDEKQPMLDSTAELLKPALETELESYEPNVYIAHRLRDRISALLLKIERMQRQAEEMQAQAGASGGMPLDELTPDQLAQLSPEQRAQMQAMQNQGAQGEDDPKSPAFSMSEEDQRRLDRLNDLAQRLSGPDEAVRLRMGRAHDLLFADARRSLREVAQWASTPAPAPETLPREFQSLYVGKDGSLLVMAYPKENIWQTENMAAFVAAMREIDPQVTGTPVQVYESSQLMRDAFAQIGLMSLAAVAILVFLDFLSLKALFFTLGPLILGVFWMMCAMGIFDLHLNLANFFAIPILIGIGVDNAVHFYHRYEETQDVETTMYTTGTTLTLTALTTSVGFGSLIFASHKGLASFGALMAIGTAACWFSCVIFMPALLKLFNRERDHHKYSIDSTG